MNIIDLIPSLHAALIETNPEKKCCLVDALPSDQPSEGDETTFVAPTVDMPGVPVAPRLVDPRQVPKRKISTPEGHAAFVHAVCHIEFSAINLALDAACRFSGMPAAYYRDWIFVAKDEATHFALLGAHLKSLGYAYGDFDAHDGLWDTARRTAHDPVRRMALVPRVMEARGLDVTPDMITKLEQIDDYAGANVLKKILEDEIGHVAIGTRWFRYLCSQRGVEPEPTFKEIVADELGRLRGRAYNREARLAAGFSETELNDLFAP